jgi:hypothetical protein
MNKETEKRKNRRQGESQGKKNAPRISTEVPALNNSIYSEQTHNARRVSSGWWWSGNDAGDFIGDRNPGPGVSVRNNGAFRTLFDVVPGPLT